MTGLRNQLNLMGTPGGPPEAKNEDLWQLVPENEDLGQLVANWGQTLVGGWAKRPAMREAHQLVHNHANALPQREQEKLRGLWTLMKTYWRSIVKYNPASNAYKKTHFLAMARTDFHSYYNNLTPAAQAAFLAGRGEFIQGDVAVIAGTQITLRRWYDSVINPVQGFTNGPVNAPRGVDLLSAQNSGTDEEPFATGTNKSMGQLPLDGQRAVFELRRLTPKVRIPIQFLYPHVIVPIFNLVTRAEQ